jgi:glutamate-1-semialdehyde 2,1-aminomutase
MNQRYAKSEQLFEEAQKIIPGGVTSSRYPSKFVPGEYPIFMNRGKGSHVWDVDGNEYIDWIVSFGPIVLGHCHPQVDEAVRKNLEQGFCFTMVHPVQNELAKELIKVIPCAEMVKFFTGGSDATSAAIRIARVYTGRDKVVRWGYHGWHDWCYGGAGTDREMIVGVPQGIKEDILTFTYNDLNSLEQVFEENKDKIACVIMQPYEASKELPKKGFLEGVKRLTHDNEAVLIYDEIRSGFRMAMGGAQEYFGVIPDLTAISKAMANGYPISAVVGKREIMQEAAKTRLSATFFVNSFPMVAALATINELKKKNGIQYMWKIGKKLMRGLTEIIEEEGVEAEVIGVPPLPMLKFTDKDKAVREELKKAFFTETTKRGVLFHPNHCWFLSLAHTEEDLSKTLEVSRESMKIAKKACH